MNVLIIDDDSDDTEMFCEVVSELIPSSKCTVHNSCHGLVSLISSLPVQEFIFLDAHMALFVSTECVKDLLTVINNSHTKIVVYTGSISPQEQEEFIGLGVYEILIKASSFLQLKTDLKSLLIDSPRNSPSIS